MMRCGSSTLIHMRITAMNNLINKNTIRKEKMYNIDKIIEMIDSNNNIETQQLGLKIAKNVKELKVFCRPINKKCWENCAKVMTEIDDEKIKYYLNELFEWISDLDSPGADIIIKRLKVCEKDETFIFWLKISINKATLLKNESWRKTLEQFL